MKIQFTTTVGDVWFSTVYRTARNPGIIGLILAGAISLTWSNPYWSFSDGGFLPHTLAKVAYLFFTHLVILGTAGLVGLSVMAPFLVGKKKGVLGLHELEAREDGVFERTDVNRSLSSYSVVGEAKCVFGWWILPVGPGFFVFRTKRVTAGHVDSFVRRLAEQKGANQT